MSIEANIKALINAMTTDLIAGLGIEQAEIVSPRTIKLTLKTAAQDGTNQIKVTVQDGKFMVRGYRYEETELFYGLSSENVAGTIQKMAGGMPSETAVALLADALKNAAGK